MKIRHISGTDDLNDAFNIRKAVFVQEQGVPLEHEIDEYENSSEHVVVYYYNKPVATGRVRIINDTAKIERICVMPEFRKLGLGNVIVRELETIAKEKGLSKAELNSQVHAKGFYKKLGYVQASDKFIEEGIPHILMKKEI